MLTLICMTILNAVDGTGVKGLFLAKYFAIFDSARGRYKA